MSLLHAPRRMSDPPATGMAALLPCVCLCVDDFGLHADINQAVLDLVRMGRIGATGAMVDGAAWPEGAAALRTVPAHLLDVGLHFDLTEALAASGQTPAWPKTPLRTLILSSYAHRLPPDLLRREVQRQLDAFEAALQRPPAFVDGHQHIHQLPQVRDALVAELAQRYAPHQRPWLRNTRARHWRGAGLGAGCKARLIAALGSSGLRQLAQQHSLPMNRALAGVYGFDGDGLRYRALLQAWLTHAAHGDVLMCHPATAIVPGDAIATARCVEYQVLASDWFGSLLEQAGTSVGPLTPWVRQELQTRPAGR